MHQFWDAVTQTQDDAGGYTGGRVRKCHSYPSPLFASFIWYWWSLYLLEVVDSPADFSIPTYKGKARPFQSVFILEASSTVAR